MSLYRIQEATFDLPRELKDKTLNIFAPPGNGPGDFSIVVSRDSVGEGMSLLRYTERQIIEMESKFSQFKLLGRHDVTLGGVPAVELNYTWVSQGTKVQVLQEVALSGAGNVLIVTATAKKGFAAWEKLLRDFLASFRFRSPDDLPA